MNLYHATSEESHLNILRNGFDINLSDKQRWGKAIYFTDDIDYALSFGDKIININIQDDLILNINYEELSEIFPFLSIEEEEGTPRLRDYVLDNTNFKVVSIAYDDGTREIVIYDESLISIK